MQYFVTEQEVGLVGEWQDFCDMKDTLLHNLSNKWIEHMAWYTHCISFTILFIYFFFNKMPFFLLKILETNATVPEPVLV